MIKVRYLTLALCSAGLMVQPAMAQGAPADDAEAAATPSPGDPQLKDFAKATIAIRRIYKAFEEPIASETDAKGKAQLEANMQAQVIAAIKQSGLDRETYNDIATRSQTDTALRAGIEQEVVALMPKPAVAAAPAARSALDTIAASPTHAKLKELIAAAGAQPTFSAAGAFTVFAPDDSAFGLLAPGTVDTLLKPESKDALAQLLRYHVVPGALTIADLTAQITAGGGTATLTTVEGQPLTVTQEGQAFKLTDSSGNSAYISEGDIRDSNGVMHVVNGVLVPTLG